MNSLDAIADEAINNVPRCLGLIDRDSNSKTFGCADRYFWHYRMHDFSNARFQEVSELLALAYLYRHPSNKYEGISNIRDWAIASARYWESLAHVDGSFDEAYPFERSFCSTSFSTLHATQTYILLGENVAGDISRTGRWLIKNDNPDVANQRAASIAALANISKLTGDGSFAVAAKERATDILNALNNDGHFSEYNGEDVGYTSITLSCLAIYTQLVDHPEMSEAVRNVAANIDKRVDECGVYDYSSQSRRTRFLYPSGFTYAGLTTAEKTEKGVSEDAILKPSWMDDRYMIAYAVDYLRTAMTGAAE